MSKKRYKETGYIKYMLDDELQMIQDWVDLNCTLKWKALFYTLMFSGLRVSEVCRLKRSSLVKGNMLRFQLSKGGRIHERALHPTLSKVLAEYISLAGIGQFDYLFPPDKNNAHRVQREFMDTQNVRHRFNKIRGELGLDDVYYERINGAKAHRISIHTFRNKFISRIYEAAGKDLIAAQRIIGHKRSETTEHYITPDVKESEIIGKI